MSPTPPPAASRRALLAAGVVVILLCGALVLDKLFRGGLPAPFDFTAFWVAGHLAVGGENPYDPARVRQLQRDLGMDDTAIVVWNPPWALTLVMPFGALGFRAAYGAWVLAHLALMIAAAELLWRGFGGKPGQRWVAYLLTLTFVPTAFLIGGGQITAVVMLGLGGFAAAVRANRPVPAGAFAALTAVKPHLLALFALWLLFERVRTPFGRRVLLGGLIVGVLVCVPPTVANPTIWGEYVRATTSPSSADHHHLSRWTPPLAGWWLRQAVPGQPFWVQWLPLGVAVIGFVAWYRSVLRERSSPLPLRERVAEGRERGEGFPRVEAWALSPRASPAAPLPQGERGDPPPADHIGYLPWLVGASLLAAPYGVWQHDLVLLLVPVFAVAVKLAARPRPAAIAFALLCLVSVNAVSLVMMLNHTSSEWYVWFTPCVLLGCFAAARIAARSPAPSLAPAGAT